MCFVLLSIDLYKVLSSETCMCVFFYKNKDAEKTSAIFEQRGGGRGGIFLMK